MSSTPSSQRESLRLAGGAAISLAGKVVGRLLLVGTQAVFARYLGMADFGRLSIGLTVLRILGIVSLMGFNRAAVVFGARYWRIDDARFRGVVVDVLCLTAACGATFGAGLAALAPWLSASVFQSQIAASTLRLFALAVPFAALLRVSSELSRVSQRMELGTVAEDVLQPVAALIAFLCLLLVTDRLDAAVWSIGIGYAAGFVFSLATLLLLFPLLRAPGAAITRQTRQILVFSMPTAMAIFCGAFTSTIDRLVVGRYCPPEQMAVYQAASQVSVAFTIIVGSFSTIFAPMAARFLAAEDHDGLRQLVRSSTRWGLYLAMPIYLFVLVMPGEILGVVFGESYRAGAVPLRILATAQILIVAAGNAGVLLVTAGYQVRWLAVTFAATLANASTSVMLVPAYAVVGGAVGNLLAAAIVLGGGLGIVHQRLGLVAHDAGTLRVLAAAAAGYAAGIGADTMATELGVVVRFFVVGTTVTAIFGLVVGTFAIDSGDRALWNELRARRRTLVP